MIEFYGSPMSSSGRTRWMLEEVEVPYEYKRVDTRKGETRTAEFLTMYGGATIPVLRDGDVVLGESMAINFYLAEKYRPELMPSDPVERAQVYQWSFWAITNLQPDLLVIMFDGMKPADRRSPDQVEAAKGRVAPRLAFLDRSLAGKEYLVGGQFTVGDLNAASVVNIASAVGLLAPFANTAAWLQRQVARPACRRASQD